MIARIWHGCEVKRLYNAVIMPAVNRPLLTNKGHNRLYGELPVCQSQRGVMKYQNGLSP
jgi:hypothetical protein